MKMIESFRLIPGLDICWYEWEGKIHFYIVFSWLFWYWSSLKEFEWNGDSEQNIE